MPKNNILEIIKSTPGISANVTEAGSFDEMLEKAENDHLRKIYDICIDNECLYEAIPVAEKINKADIFGDLAMRFGEEQDFFTAIEQVIKMISMARSSDLKDVEGYITGIFNELKDPTSIDLESFIKVVEDSELEKRNKSELRDYIEYEVLKCRLRHQDFEGAEEQAERFYDNKTKYEAVLVEIALSYLALGKFEEERKLKVEENHVPQMPYGAEGSPRKPRPKPRFTYGLSLSWLLRQRAMAYAKWGNYDDAFDVTKKITFPDGGVCPIWLRSSQAVKVNIIRVMYLREDKDLAFEKARQLGPSPTAYECPYVQIDKARVELRELQSALNDIPSLENSSCKLEVLKDICNILQKEDKEKLPEDIFYKLVRAAQKIEDSKYESALETIAEAMTARGEFGQVSSQDVEEVASRSACQRQSTEKGQEAAVVSEGVGYGQGHSEVPTGNGASVSAQISNNLHYAGITGGIGGSSINDENQKTNRKS